MGTPQNFSKFSKEKPAVSAVTNKQDKPHVR